MTEPYETIEISDDWRISVYPDMDAPNPREDMDGWVTTFIPAAGLAYGRSRPDLFTDEIGLIDMLGMTSRDITVRWARAYWARVIEWDNERRGWWYCTAEGAEQAGLEWPMTYERQQQQITAERATYEQWANGRVAQVDIEQKARYIRVDKNDEPVFLADDLRIERWEYVEGVGGLYLDDDYTAAMVASEYWGSSDYLDPDEQAKLEELANEDRQRREERRHHDRAGGDQLRAGGEAAGGASAPADADGDGESGAASVAEGPRRDDPVVAAGTDRLGRAQGGEGR